MKTRKPHRCHLCRLDIPTGTQCFYESGKWDGDMVSRWSHFECAEHWKQINDNAFYDNAFYDEEWLPFKEMSDVCELNFHQWQEMIGKKYNVLDGDGR